MPSGCTIPGKTKHQISADHEVHSDVGDGLDVAAILNTVQYQYSKVEEKDEERTKYKTHTKTHNNILWRRINTNNLPVESAWTAHSATSFYWSWVCMRGVNKNIMGTFVYSAGKTRTRASNVIERTNTREPYALILY